MKYAILVALPEELKGVDNVFYTGVGKVNATMTAGNVINGSVISQMKTQWINGQKT